MKERKIYMASLNAYKCMLNLSRLNYTLNYHYQPFYFTLNANISKLNAKVAHGKWTRCAGCKVGNTACTYM